MTERAARLVTEVVPRVPVRHWVLSVPHRLRYQLAWNPLYVAYPPRAPDEPRGPMLRPGQARHDGPTPSPS